VKFLPKIGQNQKKSFNWQENRFVIHRVSYSLMLQWRMRRWRCLIFWAAVRRAMKDLVTDNEFSCLVRGSCNMDHALLGRRLDDSNLKTSTENYFLFVTPSSEVGLFIKSNQIT